MLRRYSDNPIISPCDIGPSIDGMTVECLLNPGVFEYDGKIWLLLRVAERPEQQNGKLIFPSLDDTGLIRIVEIDSNDPDLDFSDPRIITYRGNQYLTTVSHFRLVSSMDGIHFSEEKDYPLIVGSGKYEFWGIEDCRVIETGGTYYLTYTAVSENGVAVGMRHTRDWKHFENYGLILPPHNKDCAIFGEKINGKYYALHRPSSPELGGNYMWIAESQDLVHWGNHQCLIRTRPGMWDKARVGAGGSPIRTSRGWLEIYHGADENNRYCLGALLLDLDDPSKVLARSEKPIMCPEAPYELTGFLGNVIFTNGHLVHGDKITIYYGASDKYVCMAEISVFDIFQLLNLQ